MQENNKHMTVGLVTNKSERVGYSCISNSGGSQSSGSGRGWEVPGPKIGNFPLLNGN